MSQPPQYYFSNPQQQQQQQYQQQQFHQQQSYQQPSHFHQQPFNPQPQYLMMQQHQIIPQQQPYPMSQQNTQHVSRQAHPHWFDRMCEVITTQQSRHEAGSLETPPMLTPRNYVQWSSRFLRFLELKKPHGKFLKQVILEGPFVWPTRLDNGDLTDDPPRAPTEKLVP